MRMPLMLDLLRPAYDSRMFCGFRSRWMIPLLLRMRMAAAICWRKTLSVSSLRVPFAKEKEIEGNEVNKTTFVCFYKPTAPLSKAPRPCLDNLVIFVIRLCFNYDSSFSLHLFILISPSCSRCLDFPAVLSSVSSRPSWTCLVDSPSPCVLKWRASSPCAICQTCLHFCSYSS